MSALVHLRDGDDVAEVRTVGAALSRLRLGGVEIVADVPADLADEVSHGTVLAPWPNRLAGGGIVHDGRRWDVPADEHGIALHGLVGRVAWAVERRDATSVVLTTDCGTAWPGDVALTATYALSDGGLRVRVTAHNRHATQSAPVGLGCHPYLDPGGAVDDTSVEVHATRRIVAGPDLLPVDEQPRDEDAVGRVSLAGRILDESWGGLPPVSGDVPRRVRLRRADGHVVTMGLGDGVRWVHVYTSDTLPDPMTRRAVAIEPQTCPANAPNATRPSWRADVLAPGERLTLDWSLRLDAEAGEIR